MPGNIVLIGFMGAGKSATGVALADALGFKLYDTDEMVERKAKMSIEDIFEQKGEARFRTLEHAAVKTACNGSSRVIACGGGSILQLRNHTILKEAGVVVYLRASEGSLRARLRTAEGRPLLKARGALSRLLAERAPGYEAAADVVVDTDDGDPKEIAERIIEALT
ncbi:MAG: shikimate kinase [Actinomycetota bacterium]